MNTEKQADDRRKQRRYRVKKGFFALDSSRFGSVEDISLGGVAINSLDQAEWNDNNLPHYGVLLGNDSICLAGVPFTIVAKYPPGPEDTFGEFTVKRYSLKFGNLTEAQILKLKNFIINNTDGVK